VEVSADAINAITDKGWPLGEAGQNRPLAAIYPSIYLDDFHGKLRRQGCIENVVVSIVLSVDLESIAKSVVTLEPFQQAQVWHRNFESIP
jgi:putative transposase